MFFVESVGDRVDDGQHPHQTFAREKRHAHRGLRAALFSGVIGAPQPAFVPARIRHEGGFAVLNHPAGKSAFDRLAQLLGGVLVESFAVDDGRVNGLAHIVEHHDASALAARVLERGKEQALQHGPQVERGGDLAADADEQFEQCAVAVFWHRRVIELQIGLARRLA